MRKKIILLLLTICTCFCLTSCGKDKSSTYGYQDILQQVKDGTYVSSISDMHNGWVPETTSISNAPDSIKSMTNNIANFKCNDYIGYKVLDSKIYYGFSGVDTLTNKNALVYVTQDTDNNMGIEIGDFKDISDFYTIPEESNTQVETTTGSTESTEALSNE